MSKAIILQHVDYAGPGRIVPVFRDYGIPTEIRRLDRGDEVPTDLDEVRVLVVLGGPMSVKDAGDARLPFLAQEVATLQRMVSYDRAVLGIALGAQLLAHAAGAKVYPNVKPPPKPAHGAHGAPPAEAGSAVAPAPPPPPELLPEFGWFPVTFPFPGGTEPIVYGLIDNTPMFHWHVDTFDLPKLPAPPNPAPPPAPPPPTGNALLSSSKLCRNQAFRFKTRLFGFQYHFECTEADIDALVTRDADGLAKARGSGAAEFIRAETPKLYPRYAKAGDRILRNFVQYLKAY